MSNNEVPESCGVLIRYAMTAKELIGEYRAAAVLSNEVRLYLPVWEVVDRATWCGERSGKLTIGKTGAITIPP